MKRERVMTTIQDSQMILSTSRGHRRSDRYHPVPAGSVVLMLDGDLKKLASYYRVLALGRVGRLPIEAFGRNVFDEWALKSIDKVCRDVEFGLPIDGDDCP